MKRSEELASLREFLRSVFGSRELYFSGGEFTDGSGFRRSTGRNAFLFVDVDRGVRIGLYFGADKDRIITSPAATPEELCKQIEEVRLWTAGSN